MPSLRSLPLLLLLLVAASTGRAQLQVSVASDDQYDTNPNRIGQKEHTSGSIDDLLGNQSLTLGYDIGLGPGISFVPSYTLGLTLWGSDSRLNFLQHGLSLLYSNENISLFHHPVSPVPMIDTVATDTAKAALVARIYSVADYLEDARITRVPAAAPAGGVSGSGEEQIDTSGLEELEEPEDDLDFLFGDDVDVDTTATAEGAAIAPGGQGLTAAAADSLKSRMAERLLDIADSLDLDDGSQELIDITSARIRAYRSDLAGAFPDEPFVEGVGTRLDTVVLALARYLPPGDEEPSELVIPDDWDFIYAPVSLGFQPLMRNTLSDYALFTVESDSAADLLRLDASVSRGSYLVTGDTDLARYDNTAIDGGVILQQQLGRSLNAWLGYDLAHESYPNESLFDNTQHSFTAQLRYLPSKRMMVVADAEYALKSYQEDLSPTAVRRPRRPGRQTEVAVDSAAMTSLFQAGLGLFYRPWEETSLGVAFGHQSTPALHPRLLIGAALGRGGIGVVNSVQSNLTDDIFSWNGDDIQLVAMQGLPWDLVAALRYDHNTRDYGRMTVTLNNTTFKLQDRQDTRSTFELSLSRDFFIDLGERSSALTVGLSLGHVNNTSTGFANRPVLLANYDFNFKETYGGISLQWGMW
jgi:hypothetical protein